MLTFGRYRRVQVLPRIRRVLKGLKTGRKGYLLLIPLLQPWSSLTPMQERIPDAATSGASNVTLDYDQWQPARIDPGTNDWDVKPADRKRIKFLRAIFDIDINHNDEQSGYTDNPKITFASSRLFGFQSPTLNRPSTAQVFPTVETININLECDDKPTDLPVERISHSHVVLVLKRQVIERVLGGELKWDGEVDAGVMVTWLGSTATGEKKDASSNEHHQMTHLPVMNPGVHYHIGTLPAAGSSTETSEVTGSGPAQRIEWLVTAQLTRCCYCVRGWRAWFTAQRSSMALGAFYLAVRIDCLLHKPLSSTALSPMWPNPCSYRILVMVLPDPHRN